MMLAHHGALDKLKLFHLEDGGFNHQRDYKGFVQSTTILKQELMSVIVGIIVLCKYRFYIALISLFPGYFLGSWISAKLLPGNIQRWLYRNLPLRILFGGKKVPPSWRNWFL